MTGPAIMVATSVAGVMFSIYVFAALWKESRRGPCEVVQILRHSGQDEAETLSTESREVIPINTRARGQHAVGVGERRAIRAGR